MHLLLYPDCKKMESASACEHMFRTIKRTMGATCFLLRGLEKVVGEFVLIGYGYNTERAKKLLGFDKLMELMAGASFEKTHVSMYLVFYGEWGEGFGYEA